MEKVIIEVNSNFIPEEFFKHEDPVFIISENCFLTQEQKSVLKCVSFPIGELEKGPLYIRTNSDLFKGISIGVISEKCKKAVLIRNNARIEINSQNLIKLGVGPTCETVREVMNPKRNPFEKIKIVKKPYTETEVFASDPRFSKPCKLYKRGAQTKRNVNCKTVSRVFDKSPVRTYQRTDEIAKSKPIALNSLQSSSELVKLRPVEFVFNPDSESFEQLGQAKSSKTFDLLSFPDSSIPVLKNPSLPSACNFQQLFSIVTETLEAQPPGPNLLANAKEIIKILFEQNIFSFTQANCTLHHFFLTKQYWDSTIRYNNNKNPFQYDEYKI